MNHGDHNVVDVLRELLLVGGNELIIDDEEQTQELQRRDHHTAPCQCERSNKKVGIPDGPDGL